MTCPLYHCSDPMRHKCLKPKKCLKSVEVRSRLTLLLRDKNLAALSTAPSNQLLSFSNGQWLHIQRERQCNCVPLGLLCRIQSTYYSHLNILSYCFPHYSFLQKFSPSLMITGWGLRITDVHVAGLGFESMAWEERFFNVNFFYII